MKLTNGEIYNAFTRIPALGVYRLPVATSMAVAKLSYALKGHAEAIDKVKKELIARHDKVIGPDAKEEVQELVPGHPNWKEFEKDYLELMAIECDLNFEAVKLPQTVKVLAEGKLIDMPFDPEPNALIPLFKFVEMA